MKWTRLPAGGWLLQPGRARRSCSPCSATRAAARRLRGCDLPEGRRRDSGAIDWGCWITGHRDQRQLSHQTRAGLKLLEATVNIQKWREKRPVGRQKDAVVKIKWLAVVRDVAIVWGLTFLAGAIYGNAGASSPEAAAILSLLAEVFGFTTSGCLVKASRFSHLEVVA